MSRAKSFLSKLFSVIVAFSLVSSCISADAYKAFADEVSSSLAAAQGDESTEPDSASDDTTTEQKGPFALSTNTNVTAYILKDASGNVLETRVRFSPRGESKTDQIAGSTLTTYMGMISLAGISKTTISKIETDAGFTINLTGSLDGLFSGFTGLSDITGFSGWNTSGVTSMKNMFKGCTSLASLEGVNNWDVSKVTSMEGMFSGCTSLVDTYPLNNWNTSSVTSLKQMFLNCKMLETIYASNWDVSKVIDMDQLFSNCEKLSNIATLSNWTTPSVKTLVSLFQYCSSLSDITALKNWDVSNVTTMVKMFYSCPVSSLVALSNWKPTSLSNVNDSFRFCKNLTSLSGLENWSVATLTNLNSAFQDCTKLTDISALKDWKLSTESAVIKWVFKDCNSLTDLSAVSSWDTSAVTDMSEIFNGTKISDCNFLKNWNVGNVKNMSNMFTYCINLKDLSGIANWDVSNVTEIYNMFRNSGIENNYDIANWTLNANANVLGMFSSGGANFVYDASLKNIDLSMFKDVNTESLSKQIFQYQSNIEYVKMPQSKDVFVAIKSNSDNKYLLPETYGTNVKYKYEDKFLSTQEVLDSWDDYKGKELQIVSTQFKIKYVYGANLETSTTQNYGISDTVTPDSSTFAVDNADLLGWTVSDTNDAEVKFESSASFSQSDLENADGIEKSVSNKTITYTLYAKYRFDPTQYVFVDFKGWDPKIESGLTDKDVTGYTRTMYIPTGKTVSKLVNSRYVRVGYTQTNWRGYKDSEAKEVAMSGSDSYINPADFDQTTGSSGEKRCTLYAVWTANTYTVQYFVPKVGDYPTQYTGLEDVDDIKYDGTWNYGDELTLPTGDVIEKAGNEVPIGKYLDHWNTNQTDTGVSYEPGAKVSNLSSDNNAKVYLYAFWAYEDYKIEYFNVEDTDIIASPTSYQYSESKISLGSAYRTGWTFEGWYDKDPETSADATKVDSIAAKSTGDMKLYAKFTLNTYKVNYKEADGTEITGLTPSSYTVETQDKDRALPTPSKVGYTFEAWYTSSDFSGDPVTSIPTGSQADLTYYAKWSLDSYSVTYMDGTSELTGLTPSSYSIELKGDDRNLPKEADVSKTGYMFKGWYSTSALTGETVKSIPEKSTGALIYYAKFDPITYTVTFDGNGGVMPEGSASAAMASLDMTYDVAKNVPENEYVRSGFSFKEWKETIDGKDTGNTFVAGNELKNRTAENGKTVVMVAQWNVITEGTTDKDGKVVITDPDGKKTYEIEVTIDDDDDPTTPEKPVPGATVKVDEDGVIHVILPPEVTDPDDPEKKTEVSEKDIKVEVKDENKKDSEGNKDPVVDKQVEVKDKDSDGKETDRGQKPTDSDGIAKFASLWTITYKLDGGKNNEDNPNGYEHGTEVVLNDPTKEGFEFQGWYESSDFSGSRITRIESSWAKNVTLYAKWKEIKTTLTVRTFNGSGTLKVNGVAASKGYSINVEEGQTITLTWRPTAISGGNNINMIKTIKFNDADQSAVSKISKKNWQELNTEYKRRMKQTYQMTTIDRVLNNEQTLTFVIGSAQENYLDIEFQEVAPVYRLYNMITSEHLFTTSKKEYDDWVAIGKKNKDYWIGEGVDWFSPVNYVNDSKTPKVYRLYNPNLGAMQRMSHYYTSNTTEINDLCKNWGWKKETQFSGKDGCVFLSDDTGSGVPIFTAYSEALRSSHHYTSSSKEWNGLDSGWDKERWKNVKNGKETGFFRATLSAKPE